MVECYKCMQSTGSLTWVQENCIHGACSEECQTKVYSLYSKVHKIVPGAAPYVVTEIHFFSILQDDLDNSMIIVLEIGHLSPAIDRVTIPAIMRGDSVPYLH